MTTHVSETALSIFLYRLDCFALATTAVCIKNCVYITTVTWWSVAGWHLKRWRVWWRISCITIGPRPTSAWSLSTGQSIQTYGDSDVISTFISMPSVSCRHVVGQENVNIFETGASNKLFLNLLIQFYLNNVTNLHQSTLHSMTSHHILQHGDRILTIDYCEVT